MEEVGVCMYGCVGGEREVEAKGEQVGRESERFGNQLRFSFPSKNV